MLWWARIPPLVLLFIYNLKKRKEDVIYRYLRVCRKKEGIKVSVLIFIIKKSSFSV